MAVPQKFLRGEFLSEDVFSFLLTLDIEINRAVECDLWVDSKNHTEADYLALLANGRKPVGVVNNLRMKAGLRVAENHDEKLIPEMGAACFRRPHNVAMIGVVGAGTTESIEVDAGAWAKAVKAAMKAHPRVANTSEFPFVFWIRSNKGGGERRK